MIWCAHFKWRDDFVDFTYEVEPSHYWTTDSSAGVSKVIEIRPVYKGWMFCPYDGVRRPD